MRNVIHIDFSIPTLSSGRVFLLCEIAKVDTLRSNNIIRIKHLIDLTFLYK